MGKGKRTGQRLKAGGIVGLARFVEEHSQALSYDLLTRTHYQLDDIGGSLSWASLYAFIKNLESDSALAKDLGKTTGWETTLKTNAILADIFDMLQVIHADLVAWASNGKKKANNKPYPRPGKGEDKNTRKLGSGAMPLDQLREWFRGRSHG